MKAEEKIQSFLEQDNDKISEILEYLEEEGEM